MAWYNFWRKSTSAPAPSQSMTTVAAPPPETRAMDGFGLPGYGQGSPGSMGRRPNDNAILRSFGSEPWPYAIAGRAAQRAAAQRWMLYRCKDRRLALRARTLKAQGELREAAVARKAAGMVPVAEHPALDVLTRPNPYMTGVGAREVILLQFLLVGQSFELMRRNVLGRPVQLLPLSSGWVTRLETWNPFGDRPLPGFQVSAPFGSVTVPFNDMLQIRRLDPADPYGAGVGMGHATDDELQTDSLAGVYGTRYLQKAPFPAFFATGFASEEQMKQARAAYFRQMGLGVNNAFDPHFTTGNVELKTYQAPFNADVLEMRRLYRDFFQQVVGVPPEVLGDSKDSNRATATTAEDLFATNVLVPLLEVYADMLDYQYLPQFPDGDVLVMEYQDPRPRDKDLALSVFTAAKTAFTVNEVRGIAGYPPLPEGEGGEELFQPPAQPGLDLGLLGRSETTPVRRKAEEPPWMNEVLAALRPQRIIDETGAVWLERLPQWGQAALRDVGGMAEAFDLQNPKVVGLIGQSSKRITRVTDTTRQQTRELLGKLWREGQGIEQMDRELRRQFDDYGGARAETIALTEVGGSANSANLLAWQESSVVQSKTWLHNYADQPRESHEEMDGQTVALDTYFVHPDGYATMAPGGFGLPSEDIRCHCAMIPGVDAKSAPMDMDSREKFFAKRADSLSPWVRDTIAALRRGFSKQLDDVLEVLLKQTA